MNCQHMDCNSRSTLPRPATWTVRHSGYTFPVCDAHYPTLRRELIAARIAYDSSLLTCEHGLAWNPAGCSAFHYGLVTA